MSNIKEIIIRLGKMKDALKVLIDLRKRCTLDDFKHDPVLRGALERYLQLAAESAIDIGEIIIAELDLKSPMNNRDVFEILGEAKIISPALAKKFVNVAKFRNVLVHDYVKVDLEKLYSYLRNDLEDFDKLIKAISKFLKKYEK